MTAEIAILNRTAVALAADSVVTLAGPNGSKTYDSAEKIFQLSRFQPLAAMIYNNPQFMNVPLEIIIRRFRERLTSNQISHVVEIWPMFSKFLKDFSRHPEDEAEQIVNLVAAEAKALTTRLRTHMVTQVGAAGGKRTRRNKPLSVPEFLIADCDRRLRELESQRLAGYLEDVTLEKFVETYGSTIRGALGDHFTDEALSTEFVTAFTRVIFAFIRSNLRTRNVTGLVFAGLGSQELFPTLQEFELDGFYFGEFRIVGTQLIDIDRLGEVARVVPFAQKDMPERFIFGIDAEFEEALDRVVDALVGNITKFHPRIYNGDRGEAVKAAARKQFQTALKELKEESQQSLEGIVNHLSKKELAEFAYSLVELTSRKRRYSSDQETVGGPIDVAVLSRNEGFIWVKRKHYFDISINPHHLSYRPS